MANYLIILTMFLALSVGAVLGEEKSMPARPPAPVAAVEAVERMMSPVTWVTGSVDSRTNAQIAAETEGRLTYVADTGHRVHKGEVIARIDASRLRLLFEEQQARVRRAEAQSVFLRQEVKRLSQLAEQNNAARTQLERTEAESEVAQAEVSLAAAQLQQSQDMINRATVRAPFSGVIIQRYVQAGGWATNGTLLLQMLDPQELEVQADAPLSSLLYLRPDDELLVKDDKLVKKARLRTVTNAAASASRQLALRLDIVNDGDWLVGQPVRVAVPTAAHRTVIAVPRDALVMRRSGIAVFRVLEDGIAERISVNTGIAEGDWIAIDGNISAGDRVITRGAERLRPGQNVRVIDTGKSP